MQREKSAVKVKRFEVVKIEGDFKAVRERFKGDCSTVRDICNIAIQAWLAYHWRNDSGKAIRKFMADLKAWHNADKKTRGEKPKCEIKCIPNECAREMNAAIADIGKSINARAKTLAMNNLTSKFPKQKSAAGTFPAWMSCLAGQQGVMFFRRPLPVPFDSKNGGLIPPDTVGGDWKFWNRTCRNEDGSGVKDVFTLQTKTRSASKQLIDLKRIQSGEYVLAGSNIVFDPRDGKLYCMLCIRMPKKAHEAEQVPGKSATITFGRTRPWLVRIDGKRSFIGMRDGPVAYTRDRLVTQRWARKENYRLVGSSTKGHGRQRALQGVERLSRAWRDFVTNFNRQGARRIANNAARAGCEAVTLVIPRESAKHSKCLCRAGKGERHDGSSWDFYQFESQLQRNCEELGMKLNVVKSREAARKAG